MKSATMITRTMITRIVVILICLVLFASASFAATNPLSGALGLTVDSKGNLWVANTLNNNILEYNTNYVQMTKATITSNLNFPTGLAFDVDGNLWVCNFGASNGGTTGSIAQYVKGVQNPNATITNAVVAPHAMVIDGMGNIWLSNDSFEINLYSITTPGSLPTNLVASTNFHSFSVYGLTVGFGEAAWGAGSNGTIVFAPQWTMVNGVSGFEIGGDNTGASLATSASGLIYIGNNDGTVNVYNPASKLLGTFLQLSYVPAAIAVDNVRGRLYFSNNVSNTIDVYSTTGTLLHTIQ
jgi:hypothetical protein